MLLGSGVYPAAGGVSPGLAGSAGSPFPMAGIEVPPLALAVTPVPHHCCVHAAGEELTAAAAHRPTWP